MGKKEIGSFALAESCPVARLPEYALYAWQCQVLLLSLTVEI